MQVRKTDSGKRKSWHGEATIQSRLRGIKSLLDLMK